MFIETYLRTKKQKPVPEDEETFRVWVGKIDKYKRWFMIKKVDRVHFNRALEEAKKPDLTLEERKYLIEELDRQLLFSGKNYANIYLRNMKR